MTRNVFQVLGPDLDARARFILCWTPDGCCSWRKRTKASGGTGHAIALASLAGVPVFNLQLGKHRQRLLSWLGRSKSKA